MEDNKSVNTDGKSVDISTIQALKLVLELGGENAEKIANASNEEINEVLNSVDKVRIIV